MSDRTKKSRTHARPREGPRESPQEHVVVAEAKRGFKFVLSYSTVGHFHTLRRHRVESNAGTVVGADDMEKSLEDFTASIRVAIGRLRVVEEGRNSCPIVEVE